MVQLHSQGAGAGSDSAELAVCLHKRCLCAQQVTHAARRAGLLGRNPMSRATYALHYVGPQKKPAAGVSLRAIDPERYSIIDESKDGAVLEEIEESKAFYEVYDGAVYMYQVGQVASWLRLNARHALRHV